MVAVDDTVWIMGRNNKKCLGVDADEIMTKPAMTDIKFSPCETIKSFYRKGRLVAIYTSSKNLFVSHILKPSMVGKSERTITDREGVYHYGRDDLEVSEASESTSALEWPEPPQTDFAMAYTRRHASVERARPEITQTDSMALEQEGSMPPEDASRPSSLDSEGNSAPIDPPASDPFESVPTLSVSSDLQSVGMREHSDRRLDDTESV